MCLHQTGTLVVSNLAVQTSFRWSCLCFSSCLPPPFVTVPDTLKQGGGCPALLAEPPGSPFPCKKE